MNVIQRLTWKNMVQNRKRTWITIFGTVVSVAMITAILVSFSSFFQLMVKTVEANNGSWHATFYGLTAETAESLAADEQVEESGLILPQYYGYLQKNKSSSRPYLALAPMTSEAMKMMGVTVEEGRLPIAADEIAITREQMEYSGVYLQVGDIVTMKTLQEDDVFSGATGQLKATDFEEKGTFRSYRVTAIVTPGAVSKSYYSYFVAVTGSSQKDIMKAENLSAVVKVNDLSDQIYSWVTQTGQSLHAEYMVNNQLLFYMGVNIDQMITDSLGLLILLMFAVILLGAVSLIYNAFGISLSQRSRQLGLLAATGATRSQMRGSVFFEATIISLISIPLGLLAGIGGIGITFWALQGALQEALEGTVPITLSVSPYALGVAVLLSVAMVFVSAFIPMIRAGRISPMEALRSVPEGKVNGRHLKTSAIIGKIFGFEGVLALKNIKRNHSRYVVTILSLVVSVVLFLSTSAFVSLVGETFSTSQPKMEYNVAMGVVNQGFPEQLMNKLTKVAGLKNVAVMDTSNIYEAWYGDVKASAQLRNYVNENVPLMELLGLHLYVVEDNVYQSYLQNQVSPDRDPSTLSVILCNKSTIQSDRTYTDVVMTNHVSGDVIVPAAGYISDDTTRQSAILPVFRIAAVTERTPPMENALRSTISVDLMVARSDMEAFYAYCAANGDDSHVKQMYTVFYNAKSPKELTTHLETVMDQNPGYEYTGVINYESQLNKSRQMFTIVYTFSFGFVALIVMVCTANILNTVSTGMALRVNELAMLRSVGMSPKSMKKMVNLESLFYGIMAFLWALPISFFTIFWEYRVVVGVYDGGSFLEIVPWWGILCAILVVFLLLGTTISYGSRKLREASIIDALKKETI